MSNCRSQVLLKPSFFCTMEFVSVSMLSLLAISMALGCFFLASHFLRAEVMMIVISLAAWVGEDGSWEQEVERELCIRKERRWKVGTSQRCKPQSF